jgi:hypothetical protein
LEPTCERALQFFFSHHPGGSRVALGQDRETIEKGAERRPLQRRAMDSVDFFFRKKGNRAKEDDQFSALEPGGAAGSLLEPGS